MIECSEVVALLIEVRNFQSYKALLHILCKRQKRRKIKIIFWVCKPRIGLHIVFASYLVTLRS